VLGKDKNRASKSLKIINQESYMVKRPSFWNEQTQDINDYWYNRISAYAYTLIGEVMLIHQGVLIAKGEPISPRGVNPLFIAIAGYLIYKGVRCSIKILKENKKELESRVN